MTLLFDAFWRACFYCLRPRVIALSLLPLVLMVGLGGVLGYTLWDGAVAGVQDWLQASRLLATVWR